MANMTGSPHSRRPLPRRPCQVHLPRPRPIKPRALACPTSPSTVRRRPLRSLVPQPPPGAEPASSPPQHDSPPPLSAGPSRGRHEVHVDVLHLLSPSSSPINHQNTTTAMSRRRCFCSPSPAILRPSPRPVSAPPCSPWTPLRLPPPATAPRAITVGTAAAQSPPAESSPALFNLRKEEEARFSDSPLRNPLFMKSKFVSCQFSGKPPTKIPLSDIKPTHPLL
jgi:hypothetical protein